MCSLRHFGWRHHLICLRLHGPVSLLYLHLGAQIITWTDDYIPWFLLRTHPRIQNPYRLLRGVQMPTIASTPQVLLDMVARELDRDDIDDATKVSRASDMIKRYHQTQQKI
ncbi:hypothetical protein M9H77_36803 [Catharanthus roseus]|uniref:Uncharacterized protein n=1 Tax=Catharanthus roseus TaxID=4058 RepID=A0ACB9ZUS6_CATRO|nr:hypothetical protein M9H77_36803 [Catharanthus roseus]